VIRRVAVSAQIQRKYASIVGAINYRHQVVFIKWIGTHGDYDKIDVKTMK